MIIKLIKNLLIDDLADVLPEIKNKIDKKFTEYEPNKIYSF